MRVVISAPVVAAAILVELLVVSLVAPVLLVEALVAPTVAELWSVVLRDVSVLATELLGLVLVEVVLLGAVLEDVDDVSVDEVDELGVVDATDELELGVVAEIDVSVEDADVEDEALGLEEDEDELGVVDATDELELGAVEEVEASVEDVEELGLVEAVADPGADADE
jgi:hypothetical protein